MTFVKWDGSFMSPESLLAKSLPYIFFSLIITALVDILRMNKIFLKQIFYNIIVLMVLEINNFTLLVFYSFSLRYHKDIVLLHNFTATEQFDWLRWTPNCFIKEITISAAA